MNITLNHEIPVDSILVVAAGIAGLVVFTHVVLACFRYSGIMWMSRAIKRNEAVHASAVARVNGAGDRF